MADSFTVMLVDDDKFLLDMYKKKFEQAGAQVETALGSEDALNKLRDTPAPDILILDIIMPSMDGLELLGQIHKEGLAKDSVVIMLTNESDKEKIDRAKALGIKGYIVKATSIPSEVVEETFKIANLEKLEKPKL